ncbi:glycerophosphodiester phosphodiesterase family protein [Paracoccus spongiarum]|uniref:Glycerophosphodiester phosphodiesterase family protein n=1 Tax=Paracoccus spongiarum TaxID=3064387 RepID=A0ABT9JES0_9RHOB|nr:glycerophosphodiester phosphodiesterase family protein [Paracoccus sp. 2205BS29-5]MDP5308320.1 glycerophosphodiester phosphodiesterase family protein [Paracoccus sp. 2205BS29-5]
MTALPDAFLRLPIAHRGLHGPGVPENSLAAAQAAIEAGHGIELDIQPAAGGVPMVFHDYDLARLAGDQAYIADLDPETLAEKRLSGSDEAIPTLAAFLRLVAGRVPLLVEIKDQDGRLGAGIGELHRHVADQLRSYEGPVAVMSFNPHVVAALHALMPDLPVGLTSCGFPPEDWPMLDEPTRARLADLADFESSGACFVSHDKGDLANPRIAALKAAGVPILCWTVRSAAEEARARQLADNITYENYPAGA